MSSLIVPDASVIVSWAFRSTDEPGSVCAVRLLDAWLAGRVSLLVPSLWVFEVGNIVPRKNPALAGEIMEILLDYRLPEQPMTPELCRTATGLMTKHRVTFYDAAYHAVAIKSGGVLVTLDEAYVKSVADPRHTSSLSRWAGIDSVPHQD